MDNSQLENAGVAKRVMTPLVVKKPPCMMCKFVRTFALVALLFVIGLIVLMKVQSL